MGASPLIVDLRRDLNPTLDCLGSLDRMPEVTGSGVDVGVDCYLRELMRAVPVPGLPQQIGKPRGTRASGDARIARCQRANTPGKSPSIWSSGAGYERPPASIIGPNAVRSAVLLVYDEVVLQPGN